MSQMLLLKTVPSLTTPYIQRRRGYVRNEPLTKRSPRILSKPLENEFFWPSAKQIFFAQSLEITKQLPESRRISLDFNLARQQIIFSSEWGSSLFQIHRQNLHTKWLSISKDICTARQIPNNIPSSKQVPIILWTSFLDITQQYLLHNIHCWHLSWCRRFLTNRGSSSFAVLFSL